MQVWVGTSGFSNAAWKGSFSPEDLPARGMLAYYGCRRSAVEINNTFFRMPRESVLEAWAARLRDSGWKRVYAFFRHEDAGVGPALAASFSELTRP